DLCRSDCVRLGLGSWSARVSEALTATISPVCSFSRGQPAHFTCNVGYLGHRAELSVGFRGGSGLARLHVDATHYRRRPEAGLGKRNYLGILARAVDFEWTICGGFSSANFGRVVRDRRDRGGLPGCLPAIANG